MKNRISLLINLSIPLLIAGIFYIPALFPICLVIIFTKMITTDRDTLGIFLLMYGGSLSGITRSYYPFIPVYGLIFNFIGLWLLKDWLIELFQKRSSSIIYMLFIIAVFGGSYLMAEHTPLANNKIVGIIQHGLMIIPAYYVISSSKKLSNNDLFQLLILTSIAYVAFTMAQYNISATTFYDFNWFRSSSEAYAYFEQESMLVSYQGVGMSALYGYTFLLASKDISSNKKLLLYASIISFYIIMLSGARQAILGFLIVVFLRYALFNKAASFKKVMYLLPAVLLTYFIFSFIINLGSESVNRTVESGIGDRELLYLESIRLFTENPVFGVGLGGFATRNALGSVWSHNMILEILCETGLVGSILLLIIVFSYWRRNKISLFYITPNGNYYFLILAALLIRVMVSGDLTLSIEVFGALVGVNIVKNTNNSDLCTTIQS